MARRKPTIPERVTLARNAVGYVEHYRAKGEDTEPYDLAFRGLGRLAWLHAQSRDGIAAYAASCWASGEEPYAGWTADDMAAAEDDRQAQSRHNRQVALRNSAQARANRDERERAAARTR